MTEYKVQIKGETYSYPAGTSLEKIAQDHKEALDVLLVKVNGRLTELHKVLHRDCSLELITLEDGIGAKTYERSVIFLLLKAIRDIFGEKASPVVEFSTGNGLFIRLPYFSPTKEQIDKIRKKMEELVRAGLSIKKTSMNTEDALGLFHSRGMKDKERLFKYRRVSQMNLYTLEDFVDYNYGYMVPNTGYLKVFALTPYDEGMVLTLPTAKSPGTAQEFQPSPKVFQILKRSTGNGREQGVWDIGTLNDKIAGGKTNDLILISEAAMEKQIGDIADLIEKKEGVKIVLIAGPSSSGKTTFSHRLCIQLRTKGWNPHPIEVDNYFKNRKDTPKDKNGDYDFETLEAIDVEKFNGDMESLLGGQRVELPRFNFKTGTREYRGDYLQLGKGDILVLEGIHCLNDRLTYRLPVSSKYKIYISALTQLNVDDHNRIPSTDGRLLRRMIRDVRMRGISATSTIKMWNSVRRGEDKNIFPYQDNADVIFNSALPYELSVIKQYAEPVLFGVDRAAPEYLEAKRLLKFLDYFLTIPSENIPSNSILREFIGGSCFTA